MTTLSANQVSIEERKPANITFLELAPNNRVSHVAMRLGWIPDKMTVEQTRVAERIVQHAANVANETMRQDVETLLALIN